MEEKQDAAGALSLVSQTFVLSVGSGAMADPAAGDVENIDSWLGREQPGRPVPEVSQPEASRESGVWEQHAAQPWRGSWDWNDGWFIHGIIDDHTGEAATGGRCRATAV